MIQKGPFYEFRNNTAHLTRFTFAISIVPRSEMQRRVCKSCGSVENIPSGAFDVILEGGREYPDVLGCGAYPFLIVSEAVIRAWQEAEITCFHVYPVGVTLGKVRSARLRATEPPAYFRVEIDGNCRIDLEASGIQVKSLCPACHHLVTVPAVAPGFRMIPNSWDGCRIFRDPVLYPRVNFCTAEVLEIARKHRFTNFRFDPMEGPVDHASKGIDYLKATR